MRKLIAVICAIVLVLSLAAPAFAAWSPDTAPWWLFVDDEEESSSSDDSSSDSGSSNNDAAETTEAAPVAAAPVWVTSMDLTGYDAILAEPLVVAAAGEQRVVIPALANRATLEGLVLALTQADGTVVYINLIEFANSFDPATGAITINFPAVGTCELLAPVAA